MAGRKNTDHGYAKAYGTPGKTLTASSDTKYKAVYECSESSEDECQRTIHGKEQRKGRCRISVCYRAKAVSGKVIYFVISLAVVVQFRHATEHSILQMVCVPFPLPSPCSFKHLLSAKFRYVHHTAAVLKSRLHVSAQPVLRAHT